MKTLEEIAMGALVTIGCWQPSDIPCVLRAEFTDMEDLVKTRMTGCGYRFDCDFDGDWRYLEYDIDWKRGTWIFTARTFSENSWTERKEEIHSFHEKVLSKEWSDLFGIDHTAARNFGFMLRGFEIDPRGRRVTFKSGLPSDTGNFEVYDEFQTEFKFLVMGYSVLIRSTRRSPASDSYMLLSQNELEQPVV